MCTNNGVFPHNSIAEANFPHQQVVEFGLEYVVEFRVHVCTCTGNIQHSEARLQGMSVEVHMMVTISMRYSRYVNMRKLIVGVMVAQRQGVNKCGLV